MVGFGLTDPWSLKETVIPTVFGRSEEGALAVLGISRELFAPHTDSRLSSVALRHFPSPIPVQALHRPNPVGKPCFPEMQPSVRVAVLFALCLWVSKQ